MKNVEIKRWRELVRSKKKREEEGRLAIEGDKIVEELYAQNLLEIVLTDDPSWKGKERVQVVKPSVIEAISACRAPQHHLGMARLPQPKPFLGKWVLVLDRLQDPGNVGTLIRAAFALGWEGVFLIQPGCDLFNDKALRSARGATLTFPFKLGSAEEMAADARKAGSSIAIADARGEKIAPQKRPLYLVLGSEGGGVQQMACDLRVSIPMSHRFESLNVASAGSILLYVLKR